MILLDVQIRLPRASMLLAYHLASIGCLRTGYQYAENAVRAGEKYRSKAQALRNHILALAGVAAASGNKEHDYGQVHPEDFSDRGLHGRPDKAALEEGPNTSRIASKFCWTRDI